MKQKNPPSKLSTLWENTNGWVEHYRYTTGLYLFSMLSQNYYVIIGHVASSPEHGRDVLGVINTTDKRFFFQIMKAVKMSGSKGYGTKMVMHSETSTNDVSLDWKFQKQLYNAEHKHGEIDQVR